MCGESAGLFRSEHRECRERHEHAVRTIEDLVFTTLTSRRPIAHIVLELGRRARAGFVTQQRLKELEIAGWNRALRFLCVDGIINPADEQMLAAAAQALGLTASEIQQCGAAGLVAESRALQTIRCGRLPDQWAALRGNVPFNLQKSEMLVWVFHQVTYAENRVHKQHIRNYGGFSGRIGRGAYVHAGQSVGHSVEYNQIDVMDTGQLGLTDRSLYFCGSTKAFRIPYAKLVTVQYYTDGFMVVRDAAAARPQIFYLANARFADELLYFLISRQN